MIYKVYLDGVSIHDMSEGMELINGTASIELNDAGSCDITMPYNHIYYDAVRPMMSVLDIFEGDKIVWSGRVTDYTIDWNKNKKISAEGSLAYLNDVILRSGINLPTILWEDQPISTFFSDIIGAYNDSVPTSKKFVIRFIDEKYDNILVTRTVNYAKAMDVIQEQCIDAVGGYLFTSKEWDETTEKYVNYIEWHKDIPYNGNQPVQFALNLLDMDQNFIGTEIVTAVIPLGDDGEGNKITVSSIDDPQSPEGSDEVISDATVTIGELTIPVVEAYGKITEVIEYNDVANPSILLSQAKEYLRNKQFDHLRIECDVADLKYLDTNYDSFMLGQNIRVYSTPHGIDSTLAISKITYNIVSANKKITIGTPPRQDLSELTGSGSIGGGSSSSGGSGGGGGGGGGTGTVVSVVPIITTGDSIALIYVNGRPYTLKYDVSDLETAIAGKANSSDVYTKIEMDEALSDKADSDDVYTKDETYSQEESDELFALKEESYTIAQIDRTVNNLQTQIDGKADNVDIEAIQLGIHEAKMKFLAMHNKSNIFIGSVESTGTYSENVLNQDFVMDSVSPLVIQVETVLEAEELDYIWDTTFNNYTVRVYDPPTLSFELVLDRNTIEWTPEQELIPGKNSFFFQYVISSIDRQLHTFDLILHLANGKISIGRAKMQITLSGTGLDAEGFSGVAIGEDNVAAFNIIGMFSSYSDFASALSINPERADQSDALVFPNIYSGFRAFADASPVVTSEIPPEEEGDT